MISKTVHISRSHGLCWLQKPAILFQNACDLNITIGSFGEVHAPLCVEHVSLDRVEVCVHGGADQQVSLDSGKVCAYFVVVQRVTLDLQYRGKVRDHVDVVQQVSLDFQYRGHVREQFEVVRQAS